MSATAHLPCAIVRSASTVIVVNSSIDAFPLHRASLAEHAFLSSTVSRANVHQVELASRVKISSMIHAQLAIDARMVARVNSYRAHPKPHAYVQPITPVKNVNKVSADHSN